MSLEEVETQLRAAGCVYAADEARLLLAEATTEAQLAAMVARRVAGEPLEHVLGWAELAGARTAVAPGVFVPRRRSELLVCEAAAQCRPGAVVVDLCCGSGAIGAALLAAVPGIELHAADIDPTAVACARGNVPLAYVGDLYDALPTMLRGRVDVVVCNAPYVPTDSLELLPVEARLHEPAVSLDGGTDGLAVQRRVVAAVRDWLAPAGHLLVETSDRQAARTAALFAAAGLSRRVVTSEPLAATVVVGQVG